VPHRGLSIGLDSAVEIEGRLSRRLEVVDSRAFGIWRLGHGGSESGIWPHGPQDPLDRGLSARISVQAAPRSPTFPSFPDWFLPPRRRAFQPCLHG